MRHIEEYEARAELAEDHAKRARDDEERQTFLEIAHLWRRLAEERYRVVVGD